MNPFTSKKANDYSYNVDRIKVRVESKGIALDLLDYGLISLCNNDVKILKDKVGDLVSDELNWRYYSDFKDLIGLNSMQVVSVQCYRHNVREYNDRLIDKLQTLFRDISMNDFNDKLDYVLWKTPIYEVTKILDDDNNLKGMDFVFDITSLELCYELAQQLKPLQTLSYDIKDGYDILMRILEKKANDESIVKDILSYVKNENVKDDFDMMIRLEYISSSNGIMRDEASLKEIFTAYEKATIGILSLQDLVDKNKVVEKDEEEVER